MRVIGVLGLSAVTVLAAATLLPAQSRPDQSLGGAGTVALLLQLAGALGACAAAADLAFRRSLRLSGALLAASGIALLLGAAPVPEAGSAAVFTAALAFGAFSPVFAGAAAVCHPIAGRRRRGAVAAALAVSVLVLGVLPVAVYDPVAGGCYTCPRNLLLVHGDAGLHATLDAIAPEVLAALCVTFALLAVTRLQRAELPVIAGGALVAAAGAVPGSWLVQCALLALLAAGVAVQAWRARALRGQIADIVIATLASPERLREALARSVGDPGLAIVFPGTRDGPIDADGRPAPAPAPGAATTEVTRGAHVVALLHHAAPRERLVTAARAAGPALEHASLRARLRADLGELRESRTRIVEVADEERRRAERDLHDGAQQRLIALSVALAQREHDQGAAAELRRALDDLRTLAHGIHPASLTEAGVGAALSELGERSRVPLRVTALPHDRLPPPVEAAVYRLVHDALGCAERSVIVAVDAERAVVTLPGVDTAAAGDALVYARDRVAAIDGELTIRAATGGVRVEARFSCAS